MTRTTSRPAAPAGRALAAAALLLACLAAFAAPALADEPAAAQLSVGSEEAPAPLPDGDYYLQSALGGRLMLDVAGASGQDGAKVQSYPANGSAAQRWTLAAQGDGSYTLRNAASGRMLDLKLGAARAGNAVWQHRANGSAAQRWRLARNGSGWTLSPALGAKLALEAGASKGAEARVQAASGAAAQRWWLIPAAPQAALGRTVADGVYELRLAKDQRFAVDLAQASQANGAAVRLWARNGTASQKWYLRLGADGYYTLRSLASGKCLDVAGGRAAARTGLQQWAANGSSAQKWSVADNGDGTCSLVCRLGGLVLDVAGAKCANGTAVQAYVPLGGATQRLALVPAEPLSAGVYTMACAAAPSLLADLKGGSQRAGAAYQLWGSNATMAQKFYFRRTAEGTFAIQNVYSGMYLADEGGKVVQRAARNAASAQQWRAEYKGASFVLTNAGTGRCLSPSGGRASKGAALAAAAPDGTAAQRWRLAPTRLLPVRGVYELRNAGGRALDVAGGSLARGANARVHAPNGSAAQRFAVSGAGGGWYTAVNDKSARALDVAGGSAADGANVRQWTRNGSGAQLWMPVLREDGYFELVNKASGKALEAAGNGAANDANVRQAARDGSTGQGWRLVASKSLGISGNAELDGYIRKVTEQNGYNLRKCFEWTKKNIRYTGSVSGEQLPHGIVGKQQTIKHALYAFRNKRGDCYYYAAVYKWLVIGCGYNANVRAGKVPSGNGPTAHGWTEVYKGGKTYVCDANLAVDIPRYNWYMVTYANAPVTYYR